MIRALALALALGGCVHAKAIDAEAARERVKQGAYLLDVRSPAEFAEGHLAGARNVPVNELEATMSSLPVDRRREILVFGARGPKAREILLRAGFAQVALVR